MTGAVRAIVRARAAPTSRLFWQILAGASLCKILILFVLLPHLQTVAPGLYNLSAQDEYADIASNLLAGRGYRADADTGETMLRTPGYPFVLAGIFAVAGESVGAVQVFQLALSLLAGWGVYRIALRVTESDTTAVLAAIIFWLYPATILAESREALELTFTACAILFLALFYRSIDTFAYRDFALAGAAFGLTLLTRSTLAFVLPALFAYMLLTRSTRPAIARTIALFATASLAALLVMSPWIIRNYRISGRFILTATTAPLATWDGLWMVKHGADGRTNQQLVEDTVPELTRIANELGLRVRPGEVPHFYAARDEVRYYDEIAHRVQAELIASPKLGLRLVAYNAVAFWVAGRTPTATLLNAILVLPFLALALVGAALGVRNGNRVAPVVVLIIAYYLPHLMFLGTTRYHAPLAPFLAILAAVAIARRVAPAHRLRDGPSQDSDVIG